MTVLSYGRHTASDHDVAFPGFAAVARGFAAIGEFFTELRFIFVTGFQMQANHRKLSAMSDRQLADIGLTREDIPQAVVAPFKFQ